MSKIILLELNEVPPRVLEDYCGKYPQSSLAQLRAAAAEYRTFAEDGGELSPWITWPTVHRGVTNEKHTIAHLGQDMAEINAAFPPIWTILERAGASVGIGGSLHSYPPPPERGRYVYYLPDTFAQTSDAFPAELQAFQAFNLAMVGRSARNIDSGLGLDAARSLIRELPRLGIGMRTVTSVGRQLIGERLAPQRKMRRRVLQATLSFDVMMRQLRLRQPDFATFFTNHVASAMHRFWAALYPEDFTDLGYGTDWLAMFHDEIFSAMIEADYFVKKMKSFVDAHPDYKLIITSSMGQGACSGTPSENSLQIVDFAKFMSCLGVPSDCWSRRPTMVPDYSVVVRSEFYEFVTAQLEAVGIGSQGNRITVDRQPGGLVHFTFGGSYPDDPNLPVLVGNRCLTFAEMGLKAVQSDFQTGCTGYHIPQGILLAYGNGVSSKQATEISTRDIAPSILSSFDLRPPEHMTGAIAF